MAGSHSALSTALVALALAALLQGCGDGERADAASAGGTAPIVTAGEMLSGADVPTLDPHTMKNAEIEAVAGTGSICLFRYTRAGRPVLAFPPPGTAGDGVVKLNGSLVRLSEEAAADGAIVLREGPLSFALAPQGEPDDEAVEADMVFEIEDRLRVGYRGYYECR